MKKLSNAEADKIIRELGIIDNEPALRAAHDVTDLLYQAEC
jgi:sensor domain CHASE-containing protein